MTTHPLRAGLPPLPLNMHELAVDERGYPVPYFVAWVEGKPDHRVVDATKLRLCVRSHLCWLCGKPLGRFKTFVIGPMCAITRAASEPPSHLTCATFAVQACPFLSRPLAQRREANLPEGVNDPAGVMIRRNPGAVGLWTCRTYGVMEVPSGIEGTVAGVLFEIGEPDAIEWFAQGRHATREEVEASIDSGLPSLLEQTPRYPGGQAEALREVHQRRRALASLLDQSFALRGGLTA